MHPKALLFVLIICGSACFASPVPLSGDFDIVSAPDIVGISFDRLPWSDIDGANSVYVFPYATPSYLEGYSGGGFGYNLGTATLQYLDYSFSDDGPVSGDLAIRIRNNASVEITFDETVITLTFADMTQDVFLPEFTLARNENMHFWVASDGSSYYANYWHGVGNPAMSAQASIDGEHVARLAIPEPATIAILTAGAIFTLRRRKSFRP